MSYTYSTFVTALSAALVVEPDDTDFVTLLPTIIDDAEQRLYRELDLVATSVITPATMTIDSRFLTLPATNGHIVVVDAINIVDISQRYPLKPATLDVIDYVWPSDVHVGTVKPQLFYRLDDDRVVIAPPPHNPWICEIVGTVRPTPLSSANPVTFLSTYLSDLFFCAAMCAAVGTLLKNYGAQSEDPQQAVSWETKYAGLFASAKTEELRKLFISQNSPLPASVKA
jgi:hypothetical protein